MIRRLCATLYHCFLVFCWVCLCCCPNKLTILFITLFFEKILFITLGLDVWPWWFALYIGWAESLFWELSQKDQVKAQLGVHPPRTLPKALSKISSGEGDHTRGDARISRRRLQEGDWFSGRGFHPRFYTMQNSLLMSPKEKIITWRKCHPKTYIFDKQVSVQNSETTPPQPLLEPQAG